MKAISSQHQQPQQPSLRPDAKTFVPASLLQHTKQRRSSSTTVIPININERSKFFDNNCTVRPNATPKSSRRQRRKSKPIQHHDTDKKHENSNHTDQQSFDRTRQPLLIRSSSTSTRRQRKNGRSKKNHHPTQQKRQPPLTTDHEVSNEMRKTLDCLPEVDNSDISQQLSSTKYFPSLRSNELHDIDTISIIKQQKERNTSDLSVSTSYSTKNMGYLHCMDDTVWNKFNKFALLQPQQSEAKDTCTQSATATTFVNRDVSPFHNNAPITQLVTLVRNSKKIATNGNTLTIDSTDGSPGTILSSTGPNSQKLCNDNHIDHPITNEKLPRRQPSIDKLRDRWWNLVREHGGHERIEKDCLQNESLHGTTDKRGVVNEKCRTHMEGTRWDLIPKAYNAPLSQSSLMVNDPKPAAVDDTERCKDGDDFTRAFFEGMQQGDADRVKCLLSSVPDGINISSIKSLPTSRDSMPILDWAVRFNNVQMLRIICGSIDAEYLFDSVPPFILAVELGHDECLHVLLACFGIPSLFTCRDAQGNTALHYSCTSTVQRTTFPALLDCAISTTGCTKSLLFKFFSSRNNQQQTPLHVAAMCRRADIIDLVLNHRSTSNVSMLTKLLSLQDMERQTPLLAAVASGSTDIVMSLQMWRGNNQLLKQLAPTAKNYLEKDATTTPCPLAWAVRHKNIDMVSLLLEFNNPQSESGYNLHNALSVAVVKATDDDDDDDDTISNGDNDGRTLDIIRILVAAGANPCATDIDDKQSKTAVALAALHGKPERLARLLHSYQEYLCQTRLQRRQDPKLQRQPESFFLGRESTENIERLIAGKEALLISLTKIRSKGGSKSSECHERCCLVLYEQGIQLGPSDFAQLKQNMNMTITPIAGCQYKASYERLSMSYGSAMHDKNQMSYYWSHLMSVLPWFEYDGAQKCAFFNSTARIGNMSFALKDLQQPDVVIICNDGPTLLAHRAVIGQSEKLHAAIRFASMRDERCHEECTTFTTETNAITTLNIDLPYDVCRQLLIHMYHGSILDELPLDTHDFCLQLFELILVADEYICTSLIRECMLRLLASVDMFDRCFCCYCQEGTMRHSSDEKYVTCTYHVTGPSHLITADIALDVLAIAQHVNWCPDCDNYDNADTMKQSAAALRNKSLIDYVREVALSVALCDFGTVIRSQTFVEQFGNGKSPGNSKDLSISRACGMLLTSLLKDFCDVGRL